MPRTPDGIEARTARVTIRLDSAEEMALDNQRGNSTRSDYLRTLIAADGKRRRRSRPAESSR